MNCEVCHKERAEIRVNRIGNIGLDCFFIMKLMDSLKNTSEADG